MIKILFLCHGNICRSPMAEYVMKYVCLQSGVAERFQISSAAVSTEEIGNDIYPPAKRKLYEKGIPFGPHAAHRITQAEYNDYDYIICADYSNIRWMARFLQLPDHLQPHKDCKLSLMMQWAGEDRDVADPWYTGDFEAAYRDIYSGCSSILNSLIQ